MVLSNIIKILSVLTLALSLSGPAFGKKSGSKKPKRMRGSLKEAMSRSSVERKKHHDKITSKTEEDMSLWNTRSEAIVIEQSNVNSGGYIGGDEFSIDDSGEDNSGLGSLRTHVEEEPTENIDFDKELRDVSSYKRKAKNRKPKRKRTKKKK